MSMDIQKEIDEANKHLPVIMPDIPMPFDTQIRIMALSIAQRHCGDTCVKEGALYQQLKMDNKLGERLSVNHVLNAALAFERYLWGEWSKGIAENAINSTSTQIADALEERFKDGPEKDPSHKSI